MSDDNLEGPEVDSLIRELSARKLAAAKPAVSQSPAAAPSPAIPPAARPFGSQEAPKPIAPAGRPKKFVSAISVESLPSLPSSSSFRSLKSFRSFWSFLSFLSLPSFSSLPSFPSVRSLPSLSALNHLGTPRETTVVRICVGLAVSLASAMPFWPYPRSGAWWMLFYLFAVAMVLVSGVWSAQLTWRTRLGYAHTLALVVVLWGITLATVETLRSGYFTAEAAGLWP